MGLYGAARRAGTMLIGVSGGRARRVRVFVGLVLVFLGLSSRFCAAVAALIITPTFDSTITSNANAAAIEGSINAAIGIFQSQFSTPITVTIDFRYDTTTPCGTPPSGFIATSCSWEYASDYASIVAALTAQATTANDATAVAHLPGSVPVTSIVTTSADTRALGCATCSGNEPGGFDGIVTLNSSEPLQFSRSGGILAGNYDAETALEHEIDEVLGIGGTCSGGTNLPCTTFLGQSAIGIMDLFRYSAPGALSFTTDPSATAYFSIDGGATEIVGFNQSGVGDYGDFASGCFVQSFAECPGASSDVTLGSPEGVALDVIGYDPVSVPEPSSLVLCATAFLGLAWRRRWWA
jgi:hypothetical protein